MTGCQSCQTRMKMETNKYNWNTAITKLLIREYEHNEMLYNPKHVDYKNRNKRLAIYRKILSILNKKQGGCELKDLKRKINGLRSQYLAEKYKVTRSRSSSAVGDPVYTPTVYWYPLMKFLDATNDGDTSSVTKFEEVEDNLDYPLAVQNNLETHLEIECIDTEQPAPLLKCYPPKRKKRPADDYQNLLVKATRTMSEMSSKLAKESDDDITTFGKFVISELRGINASSDKIIYRQAKRKIQEVLISTWEIIDSKPQISTSNSLFSESSINFNAQLVDDDSSYNLTVKEENSN